VIGLFFLGIGVTFFGALIAWYILNNFVLDDDE